MSALQQIIANESLTFEQKKTAIAAARIDVSQELVGMKSELNTLCDKRDRAEKNVQVLKELMPWLESPSLRLERNECSRYHKLLEACKAHAIIDGKGEEQEIKNLLDMKPAIFLVEHDWAGVFGEEIKERDNDISLPFPFTVFEMRISGRTVILACYQEEGSSPVSVAFLECNNGCWYAPFSLAQDMPAFHMPWWQVKAICIALDAEVVTRQVVRAPHALNVKREKHGRLPLLDFHVVRLNRKHRACTAFNASDGDRTRKRLHFRRGHWRHFESSKTWVRWALVGNPDLGFIDKHYKA